MLAAAVLLALLGPAAHAAPPAGRIAGTIAVERAAIRTAGAKHDRDVVVMLRPLGVAAPAARGAVAEMDQEGLVFVPHVLAVQRGTTVTFLNSDREQHNVYFLDDRTGDTLDIGTWGPGVSVDHTFAEPGMVIVLCKLHLEMAAYVVVTDSPWFTTVAIDPEGQRAEFTIDSVPTGEYELTLWHKKLKQKGGPMHVTVAPGATDRVQLVLTKAAHAGRG